MSYSTGLSGNDAAVLGALFDPEASLQNHAKVDLQKRGPYSASTLLEIKNEEKAALSLINTQYPSVLQIERSISHLSNITRQFPKYASAWNNRAQARRMLEDLDPLSSPQRSWSAVFEDLAEAIRLASPKNAVQMVSEDDANVLASAHTHRAFLLWNASRPNAPTDILKDVENLHETNKEQLEELASRDFSLGGKYGNQTARQLAVKTNPYAKLCGSIVREALQKEINDFHTLSHDTA